MTRLEWYMSDDAPNIRYPEDVATLRTKIPELARISAGDVQTLYEMYSEEWCASWLIFGSNNDIEHFRKWLLDSVNERGDTI
jgi:hypothetical protein